MRLPNPHKDKPFNHESGDHGFRTLEDGTEEIVDTRTGKSNTDYWQPEQVTFYEGCNHLFKVIDIGKREVECQSCRLMTNFHPAVNYKEESGKSYIVLNRQEFEILP